jgi:hypothetical protein
MWDIDQTSGIFTGFSQRTSGFPGQLLFQQCFSFIFPSVGSIRGYSTSVQKENDGILMYSPWNLMMDPLRHKIYNF